MGETLVMGAGLAGLTAAYELGKHGAPVRVFESAPVVGGASRTVVWQDFRFDLGGHRLYTRDEDVLRLVNELVGKDLLRVGRVSRIYFNGHFVDYPLSFFNALGALGPFGSAAVTASYMRQKVKGLVAPKPDKTFEDWIVARFGRRLYNIYFKSYSEKVWGVPCSELGADFAAQRIKGLSFRAAIKSMFKRGSKGPKTLVSEFLYPRLGFGMIPENMAESVGSSRVHLSCPVTRVRHDGSRVLSLAAGCGQSEKTWEGERVIATIPVNRLLNMMEPAPPAEVIEAAKGMKFRDLVVLFLALNREKVTDDHWIYFPDADTFFGRMHEPKNWSKAMAPPDRTGVVVEVFCFRHEPVWSEPDESLMQRAATRLEELGLFSASELAGGTVIRLTEAYPLYDSGYEQRSAAVFGYLKRFSNLLPIGRNALFRYTSGDRYMEMGLKTAWNILGMGRHNVDAVATEQEYAEQ